MILFCDVTNRSQLLEFVEQEASLPYSCPIVLIILELSLSLYTRALVGLFNRMMQHFSWQWEHLVSQFHINRIMFEMRAEMHHVFSIKFPIHHKAFRFQLNDHFSQ